MPESQSKCASRNCVAAGDRSKRRRRGLAFALSIVCSMGLCGCSTSASLRSITSSGTWNDTVEMLRNRSFSAKAYYRRQHHYSNFGYPRDFKAGFRAGYEAIADGKPGCPPAFPPKEYWSWEFQSAEGQARTRAWFEGYPYGVQAAREDGVNQWSSLVSSSKCGGGCSSPTPTGECGCGHCGSANAISGLPMGAVTTGIGDQVIYQDIVREGDIASPSDVPQSVSAPVPESNVRVPTTFPNTN